MAKEQAKAERKDASDWAGQMNNLWPSLDWEQAGTLVWIALQMARIGARTGERQVWVDCRTGDYGTRHIDGSGKITEDIGNFPSPPVARPRRSAASSALRLVVDNIGGVK